METGAGDTSSFAESVRTMMILNQTAGLSTTLQYSEILVSSRAAEKICLPALIRFYISCMEDKMLTVGDIITDHDEGGTGIVNSVDVHRWANIMIGSVHIHWIGEGIFATAWGWEFPRSIK